MQKFFFSLLLIVERMLLFKNKVVVNKIVRLMDVTDLFAFVTRLKFKDLISDEKLAALKSLELDLIIKIGDEVEGLEQLAVTAKLGLISAEFSADVYNETLLSGFWEVLYKLDTTNFSVSRIFLNGTKEMNMYPLFFRLIF